MKVVTVKPGDYIIAETIDDQISIHTSILADLIIRLYLNCRIIRNDKNKCLNAVVRNIEAYLDDIVDKVVKAIKMVDNVENKLTVDEANKMFDEILTKLHDIGLFVK
jgi:hypothetical protein